MENTEEVWKDVVGYEDYYQVSSLGRIRSLDRMVKTVKYSYLIKGKILSHSNSKKRYPNLMLNRFGKFKNVDIHRLMAIAFLPNPLNKKQVNHINGIKNDNRLENLEWVTPKENSVHSRLTGLAKQNGEDSVWAKLKNEDVLAIREMAENGITFREIGEKFGIHAMTAWNIANRRRWKHI